MDNNKLRKKKFIENEGRNKNHLPNSNSLYFDSLPQEMPKVNNLKRISNNNNLIFTEDKKDFMKLVNSRNNNKEVLLNNSKNISKFKKSYNKEEISTKLPFLLSHNRTHRNIEEKEKEKLNKSIKNEKQISILQNFNSEDNTKNKLSPIDYFNKIRTIQIIDKENKIIFRDFSLPSIRTKPQDFNKIKNLYEKKEKKEKSNYTSNRKSKEKNKSNKSKDDIQKNEEKNDIKEESSKMKKSESLMNFRLINKNDKMNKIKFIFTAVSPENSFMNPNSKNIFVIKKNFGKDSNKDKFTNLSEIDNHYYRKLYKKVNASFKKIFRKKNYYNYIPEVHKLTKIKSDDSLFITKV